MSTIHNVVEKSSGAYTHDEVFMLDADFIQHISLMWYEVEAFQGRVVAEKENLKPIVK